MELSEVGIVKAVMERKGACLVCRRRAFGMSWHELTSANASFSRITSKASNGAFAFPNISIEYQCQCLGGDCTYQALRW